MNRLFPLAALVLIAACQKQDPVAPEANEVVAQPAAKAEVPSLEGNWKVTKVSGIQDAAGLGMTASMLGGSASLSAGCVRRAWTYTQKRNVVAFTTSPGGSSNCGGSAPNAGQETAYAALTEANIVIFSKDGKEASLSGTGGALTLERR